MFDDKGVPVTLMAAQRRSTWSPAKTCPTTARAADARFTHQPRRAEWPQADVVVGNCPSSATSACGPCLAIYWPSRRCVAPGMMPEPADFVMFWWHHRRNSSPKAGFALLLHQYPPNSSAAGTNRRVVQGA